IPILGCGLLMIARKALPVFRAVFKKYDKLNESVEENVRGLRVVKSFVREDYEKQKFAIAAGNVRKDFTKAEKILAFNNPLMLFAIDFCMLVIPFFAARLIVSSGGSSMMIGNLSSLMTYSMQILMSLMMLSMIFVMFTFSIESARRITEVIDTESTIKNPENPVTEVKDGSIDFENVDFKYSEGAQKFALSDINLHIASGQTVGIIGGTGSSKTTLIQLIPRLYDVTDGTVRVGGIDVRDYDLKTLRHEVSVVLQKNVLFSGTIKDNVRWGKEDATDEEIYEACRLAQADEYIQSFPDKYDKYIEQGGANVSGGQKQRLCIARALIAKPKILILDDSTSAVDTKTDALIRKAFAEEIPDTTKIIIAQRVASVEDADMIIVMDNGTISDTGTHEELLERSPIYREVYESQTKGGEEDA
ncbi:MAG: ABC transporter ATP-binding protein, partial [Oscillospiraceae bacterium]|nr:ABC transporter ATP-binding protein [Oscillospiraceae bacterium]